MARFSILIPSRDRPQGLARAIANVLETTAGHDIEIIPILDEPDTVSIRLVESAGPLVKPVIVDASHLGRPQAKYNAGYRASTGEWIVTGADDITFDGPGWLDAALAANVGGWVGLFDHVHPAWSFATLFMAQRAYVNTVLCGRIGIEAYHVWMSDMEISILAQRAGCFVICEAACFTHHHHLYGRAENDPIYQLASTWYAEDDATFQRRLKAGFPCKEDV